MIKTIAVVGAGTMGSGIAQVAAQSGHSTILFDLNKAILEKAAINIKKSLQYLTNKKSISAEQEEQIFKNILFTSNINDCIADLIIEAIVENAPAKIELFNTLSTFNSTTTIFATNTSSLSITQIQAGIICPERVVGMHFFNPAPAMKLVEIIKGHQTNAATLQAIAALCNNMNKVPVICKDSPGFIVNRIARQYYLEAMQLVEEGIATFENIDTVMEATGFKMGPFKLMDLIGLDINLAVSKSIYEAFNFEVRFLPAAFQIDKVNKGQLGRKAGKGFYQY